MSQLPKHVFNAYSISDGDMSGDITGSVLDINEIGCLAVQAVWSGSSPVGNVLVKGSNDGINYTPIASGSLAVSGNTGSAVLNVADIGYASLRVDYDNTSGSGTLNVKVNAKR